MLTALHSICIDGEILGNVVHSAKYSINSTLSVFSAKNCSDIAEILEEFADLMKTANGKAKTYLSS